jgi:hypothetical protein
MKSNGPRRTENAFMANPAPNHAPEPPETRPYDLPAGLLSYLVPGLGQIYQGRIAKGMLFLVCLYGMFFGGMALGAWKNVYLVDIADEGEPWANNSWHLPRPAANLVNRLHFVGQFWIGVAAWPAIWQYNRLPVPSEQTNPFLHNFERAPQGEEGLEALNENQRQGKLPDIAWVYTVVAGVLNILVIYDALAGPAFVLVPKKPTPPVPQEAAG